MKNIRMGCNKLLFLLAIASMFFTALAFAAGLEESEKKDAGQDAGNISARQLMGLKVVNRDGKEIGKITEVKKQQSSGRINYVVIGGQKLMGLMDSEYSVPFRALKVSPDEKQATLDVDDNLLADAPRQAPDTTDTAFQVQLEQHYGISPTWEPDQAPQMENEGMPQKKKDSN
jgi:sporulation protein YlmC with PRC-barrel domain